MGAPFHLWFSPPEFSHRLTQLIENSRHLGRFGHRLSDRARKGPAPKPALHRPLQIVHADRARLVILDVTGVPIVDAGMRELWATGWMHNRVRMIVASFLTKDLLMSWHDGAKWFWDTLVDADLANNTLGWQWTAGCGADAAPFFRIFNPVSQGEKFDPSGNYVKLLYDVSRSTLPLNIGERVGPITFQIVDNNGNNIPDVTVTGATAGVGDGTYNDIANIVGTLTSIIRQSGVARRLFET